MNLQQVEYIVAVDKYKNFSKAADSCFVTQATLSTMVKKLESELDIVIFDRKTNPTITTDCGKLIIEESKKILYHIQKLKTTAAEIKGIIEGELIIGVIPTIAGNLLHRILPVLLEKYPKLKLTIKEMTTNNIISAIKNGELDCGIVSTPLTNHHEMEEIILYYEKLLVYGQLSNSTNSFISPKDIKNEDVWLLEKGNCLSDQIINVCSLQSKKINSNLQFSPNSFESLINIVDNFNGLTLIPELYYHDLPEKRKAKVIDFQPPFPVREVGLIFHRPYAKIRLIETVSKEIKNAIQPYLQTSKLKSHQMNIAKM